MFLSARLNLVKRYVFLIGLAGSFWAIDQASKYWVSTFIPFYTYWEPVPAMGHLFRLYHIGNTGTAFGLFGQAGPLFAVIGLVVVAGILYYYPQLAQAAWWAHVGLSLQLGGALGNLSDRLRLGYVVDFIHIGFLPIFNLADIFIVLGVSLLVFYLWYNNDS